eukprot:461317-Prymnesium_polylepis.2
MVPGAPLSARVAIHGRRGDPLTAWQSLTVALVLRPLTACHKALRSLRAATGTHRDDGRRRGGRGGEGERLRAHAVRVPGGRTQDGWRARASLVRAHTPPRQPDRGDARARARSPPP